jgi:chromate transporter
VLVLVISALYVRAGALWWIGPAFVGVGAAVMCIVGRSIVKLTRLTLGRSELRWAIALVNAAGVVAWRRESVLLLLASGIVVVLAQRGVPAFTAISVVPLLPIPAISLPGAPESLLNLFTFFARAGAVVFGSGLAIIPFLYSGAVEQRHWLTDRQFVDAIAVAMITPGPVVIVATFVGYLVGGVTGGVVAALGVFLPPYIIVLIAAPRFREYVGKARVRAMVDGITAGATGALIGAALLLGVRTLAGAEQLVIAGIVLLLLTLRVRIPEPVLIIGAGLASIAQA